MTYSEWNNHIAKYFFKSENAGKNILFYLTKQDLINYSRQLLFGKLDDEIWSDFIHAIKYDQQCDKDLVIPYSPINKPFELYKNWNKTDTPPFIAYLILYIIPLTETYDEPFYATNYYGKVNVFFKRYGILNSFTENSIGTTNYQNISSLWNALEEWAVITKNCDLGIFELKKFGNQNWIHVGKPFSQCVLPPSAINKLPELFFEAGLIPDSAYSKEEFRKILLKHGIKILCIKERVIELIRKSDTNELGQSIIEIVNREYKKWTGETHEYEENGATQRIKRNYTVAPLFLQFKVNTNDERIKFSYRMRSQNDYPEDLKFGEYENLYEINGWSKTLQFEFKEGLELKDNFNKWITKFPDRDARLFISAGTFQLSNDFWIETDFLSRTERMYLLCKNDKQELIKEWGKTFGNGNFKQEDFEGLPESYSLFWFRNPTQGLSEIPNLTLYTKKRIDLVGGVKVNFRTYSNEFLPEVEIVNSDGKEKVYLQYKETNEKIYLSKKTSLNNRWLLPEKKAINSDFYIKIEGEIFSRNEIAYNLISSDNTAIQVDGSKLPKRDSFGRNIRTDAVQYCLGSNIINPMKSSQRYFSTYGSLFTSTIQNTQTNITTAVYNNHNGNNLCNFLSLKSTLTTEEFFKAFEFFYSKEFPEYQSNTNYNLTKLKRASLNFYDYIGILDYDYETKTIVLNPPQFIFIPTSQGRKVLLIGARDSALIEKIIKTAIKHNLQVEIVKQFPSNERLLLPDVVTIKAFQQANDTYGEKSLKAFAEELKIKFSSEYFLQVALQDFSANIDDYENTLQVTSENDYNWARYIFNPETLRFEKSETANFDKSFSLLEYKLNEYTYQHKLWKVNKCYQVDLNWGRFVALKYFQKNVILYDSIKNKVAIPIELPLPRLLAEAIMLLSGFAPDFKMIEERKYRVYTNIDSIFTVNLFRKLGQMPINKEL